jgi:hypothetical protein
LRVVNAPQRRLHVFDFIAPAEAPEPGVRATQEIPSVLQMSARLTEVDAVDRDTSIEDRCARPEQVASQLGGLERMGCVRLARPAPDPPAQESDQQPSNHSENELCHRALTNQGRQPVT